MWSILFKIIEALLSKQETPKQTPEQKEPEPPSAPPPVLAPPTDVDWSNPDSKISKYFTVREATYLPSWKTSHIPTEQEKANILAIAQKMDLVREFLNEPILVHVWIRPGKASCPGTQWDGKDYNEWLYKNVIWKNLSDEEKAAKKVPNSPHKTGDAVDWSVKNKSTKEYCALVRQKLLPKLAEWDLRMEDIDGSWVHLDCKPVVNKRFFKP